MPINKTIDKEKTTVITKVGVEYAHIYTDQQFSKQHELGIKELKTFLADEQQDSRISKVVLIDDYSPGISLERFDLTSFIRKLSEHNAMPDIVVPESALTQYCEQTLELVTDKKLKKRLSNYVKTRQKYPCSLFVAAWYLLRLGAFGRPELSCVIGNEDELLADTLVTILPDSFTTPEEQALDIIRSTSHADLAEKVHHIMFEHQELEYSDWQLFDAEEYVERNYGRAIMSEDRQIIDFVVSTLKELQVPQQSLDKVADIGVGPNLYPALLLSPYLSSKCELRLIDFATSNLEYLKRILRGGDIDGLDVWLKFEKYMEKLGHAVDMRVVENTAVIERGSIFEQPNNTYDAVLSFFVSDSITNDGVTFEKATESLMNALKPNGLFIVAHMVGSHGYFAGERTFFPAVDLTIEAIEAEYDRYGDYKSYLVTHENERAVRKGYKGMAVLVGKKH